MYSLEDLGVSNIKIYQKDGLYKFTSDSILLAKFSKVKRETLSPIFAQVVGLSGFTFTDLIPIKLSRLPFLNFKRHFMK